MKLFLDDLRMPVDDTWVIARSVEEAKELVLKCGVPLSISFDHDLGGAEDAPVFLRWLIDRHLDGVYDISAIDFHVHSANPVGRRNLEGLWQSFQAALQLDLIDLI